MNLVGDLPRSPIYLFYRIYLIYIIGNILKPVTHGCLLFVVNDSSLTEISVYLHNIILSFLPPIYYVLYKHYTMRVYIKNGFNGMFIYSDLY